jgi:hypothetical protein
MGLGRTRAQPDCRRDAAGRGVRATSHEPAQRPALNVNVVPGRGTIKGLRRRDGTPPARR